MKINLDFDTEKESLEVAVLALRADAVHGAITDLALQLNIWIHESPDDSQSKAFQQVLNWILEEFPKRGLLFDSSREGMLKNRAGEIAWKRTNLSFQRIAKEIVSQDKKE